MSETYTLPGESVVHPVPGQVFGILIDRTVANGTPAAPTDTQLRQLPIVMVTHIGDEARPHVEDENARRPKPAFVPSLGGAYVFAPGEEVYVVLGRVRAVLVPVTQLRGLVRLPPGFFRGAATQPGRAPSAAAVPVRPTLPPEPVRDVRQGHVFDGPAPSAHRSDGASEQSLREQLELELEEPRRRVVSVAVLRGNEAPHVSELEVDEPPYRPVQFANEESPIVPHARQIGLPEKASAPSNDVEVLRKQLADAQRTIAGMATAAPRRPAIVEPLDMDDEVREPRGGQPIRDPYADVDEARRRAVSVAVIRGEQAPHLFDRDALEGSPAIVETPIGPVPVDLDGPEAQDFSEQYVEQMTRNRPVARPAPKPVQPDAGESSALRRKEALQRALGRAAKT